MKRDAWNRCDECGRFVALEDIEDALDASGIVPDPNDEDSVWSEDASEYYRLNSTPANGGPDA